MTPQTPTDTDDATTAAHDRRGPAKPSARRSLPIVSLAGLMVVTALAATATVGLAESPAFDSGNIESGGTYTWTPETTGIYGYHCTYHTGMNATIEVVDGDPGDPVNVTIEGFAFEPANLTVTVGTEITWTNLDSAGHTVTADDDAPSQDDGSMEGNGSMEDEGSMEGNGSMSDDGAMDDEGAMRADDGAMADDGMQSAPGPGVGVLLAVLGLAALVRVGRGGRSP